METLSSPDEAGLSSTLKYERSCYNNASVFLPNTPIIIKIVHSCESQIKVDAEDAGGSRSRTENGKQFPHGSLMLTNQSWYEMRLKHGNFEWTIHRSFAELKSFHTSFMLQRTLLSISGKKKEIRRKLSPFPPTFDFAGGENLYNRRVMLERYIQSIIDVQEYRETDPVLRLLEVSPLSFVNCSGGLKLKEDCVNKLPSYNYLNKCCCVSGICLQKRWLILKDSYFVYMKQHGDKVKAKDIDKSKKGKLRLTFSIELSGKNRSWRLCNIFLIDQNFAFKTRIVERSGQRQLKLYNSLGELIVICQSDDRMNDWNNILSSHIYEDGTRDFIQYNRFGSYAPPRPDTHICMFIDGACYMEAVAKAIAQAQHEIFITDWCMHPTVFLRRPVRDNKWRLDMLLHAKAKQGVKIYILLYKESELAVKFRSMKVKRWLRSLHSNIYVYRSPRSTRLWSHHEKMVAVDQSIVFLGGIDLCFGRWDTNDHRLQDVHKDAKVQEVNAELLRIKSLRNRTKGTLHSQGKQSTDFANLEMHTISSESDVTSSNCDNTPKSRRRRLTNAIHRASDAMLSIMYQIALDRKESQRVLDAQMSPAYCELEWGNYDNDSNFIYNNPTFEDDNTTDVITRRKLASLEELSQAGKQCTWIGQDYVNWSLVEPVAKEHPALDLVDRTCIPRTPWHDVGCAFVGTAACDISRHFIQRWNQIRSRKIRSAPKGSAKRIFQRLVPGLLPSHPCSPWTETKLSTVLVDPRQSTMCTVQALRSVSNWSLGIQSGDKKGFRKSFRKLFHQNLPSRYKSDIELDEAKHQIGLEKSILKAYIKMIHEAENFIYIENQYFVSYILGSHEDQYNDDDFESEGNFTNAKTPHKAASDFLRPSNSNGLVKNRICEAIYLRILRAY
ncbi:Phospholipase D1, partial [Schistosoma japonicum]